MSPASPTKAYVSGAVSVVVPVYNGAKYLRESLQSIVTQTHRPHEIIVMDDASTDDSGAIAKSFGAAVDYVRQPVNRGQFRNVEDGIARARGEFVAVFHADDIYDARMVEKARAALVERPDVGLVFVLDSFIDADGREYGRLALPSAIRDSGPFDLPRILNAVHEYKNVFMPTPGAMARTHLYQRVGEYRTEFGSAADLDMWLRLARLAQVLIIEEHLFKYRHTVSSEGQSYQRLRTTPENYFAIMDRQRAECPDVAISLPAMRAFAAHRAVDALRTCVNAYLLGDLATARANWRRASLGALLGSSRIDRPRHLLLWALLPILCSLPRSERFARMLHWRYYGRLPWWNPSAATRS